MVVTLEISSAALAKLKGDLTIKHVCGGDLENSIDRFVARIVRAEDGENIHIIRDGEYD